MPLLALDAVVLDCETTGLDARRARLLRIAAVPLSPRIATAQLTKSESAALKITLRDVEEAIGLVSEGLI